MLQITNKTFRDYTVLVVNGDLTMMNVINLEKEANTLLSQGKKTAIDLSKLNLIDSSGMGLLVRLHEFMKRQNYGLTLINPPKKVRSIFQLTSISKAFRIIDSENGLK